MLCFSVPKSGCYIKVKLQVENYVISLLGLGPATREITVKFLETIKRKKLYIQVTLRSPQLYMLNIYFTSIFQGMLLGLKQFVAAVYKDQQNK